MAYGTLGWRIEGAGLIVLGSRHKKIIHCRGYNGCYDQGQNQGQGEKDEPQCLSGYGTARITQNAVL